MNQNYLPLNPLHVGSSETKSEDIDDYVAKKRTEVEEKKVKTKKIKRIAKTTIRKKRKSGHEDHGQDNLSKDPRPVCQIY